MTTVNPAMTEERFAFGVVYQYNGVAMSTNEDRNAIFAWGDQDDQVFADAVTELYDDVFGWRVTVNDDGVRHLRAVDVSDDDHWAVDWSDEHQDHPESFPITIIFVR